MAAVYKQSTSVNDASSNTVTTKTFASACTNPSILVAVIYWASGTATCSVSDPTNGTWNAVGSPISGNGLGNGDLTGFSAQAFWVANAATTALTVTATISATVSTRGVAIHEYTGVSSVEAHWEGGVTGTTSPTATSETPSSSNDLVFDWIVCGGSESAVSAAFVIREKANFGNNGTADVVAPTGGNSYAAQWTCTDSTNILGNIVFAATVASSVPTLALLGVGS